ncbi:alpha-1,4-glucan--maltose-1-phosphate maltosyltransferase [Siccirubricoccus phaeus]|uniref:alpha-1,4-glucan--maltose-1-phosphate maltosyltransferase n=1 Tax=Siccirubricoccus phaeus TaxID=2595053 RepID=UPI001F3E4366|nr:alpha-1,4-glucan--maltose-1-phosphate maltosyltransferase [Siccirubricoccus phaeus]
MAPPVAPVPEAAPLPVPPVPAPPVPVPMVPRLYLINPLLVGALPQWDGLFAHIAALGFDSALLAPPFAPGAEGSLFRIADPDAPHPILEAPGDAAEALRLLAEKARAQGLALYLDLVLDRVAADGVLARSQPGWVTSPADLPDPRLPPDTQGLAWLRWEDGVGEALYAWWEARLRRYVAAGIAGFRCLGLGRVPPGIWRRLAEALPEARFLGWTPGLPAEAAPGFAEAGFAAVFDSAGWWDFRQGWYAEEAARLAPIAPAITTLEPPFGPRLGGPDLAPELAERAASRQLRLAAGIGAGMLLPMGFEFGARRRLDPVRDRPEDWSRLVQRPADGRQAEIRAANAMLAGRRLAKAELRPLAGPEAGTVALLRAEAPAAEATLLVANADLARPHAVAAAALLPALPAASARFRPRWPEASVPPLAPGAELALPPGAALLFQAETLPAIRREAPPRRLPGEKDPAVAAAAAPRIGLEAIAPAVEGGRFPVKRSVGEEVEVTCDILCDGHDQLGAALLWRPCDAKEWHQTRMRPLGNDRWVARFPLERMGLHVFAVEAWRDAFASFRDELRKKHEAGVATALELEEGRRLVAAAAKREGKGTGGALRDLAALIGAAAPEEKIRLLLAEDTAALMAAADDRPFRTRSAEMPVEAERLGARFASWYECFPRSQSGSTERHGTFDDVIRRLPHIRAMGFDVLYFPPIHPIGTTNRKGRNNTLTPTPDDPGSPYAIGSAEGGHDAVHPELGGIEGFRRLRAAAERQGLEIALDFAIQCSPDHPWLKQHKGWFDWRPDGSIKYAENPPKRYQDIVNVDFYAEEAVPGLWLALRDVVLFWCAEGVRLFRVDNPHTKPFPFWEWLIAEVRGRHPDAVFLAEAFTRPKIMYRLGKIGFSQSYTYFTWRNEKREITEYLEELTDGPPRDFYRPHFFVNTPDINPPFLQTGGRPAHLIRLALATTLSGLWGMQQGFELCEATPLPGREEYLNSDKYEIRARPDRAPGDIVDEIARLNIIRRQNPALQSHLGLRFLEARNPQVIFYRKSMPDRSNVILTAVSLDPFAAQETEIELPLWEWGLPDHAALAAEDLFSGERFTWHGKWQRLRLEPASPFRLWRVRPEGAV